MAVLPFGLDLRTTSMSVTSVIFDDEPALRHARRLRDPQQSTVSTLRRDLSLVIVAAETLFDHRDYRPRWSPEPASWA
jgi:hypothetical protein